MLTRRKNQITASLEQFLAGAPLDKAIIRAVIEAGASAKSSLVPMLQTIAETTSKGAYAKITQYALESLCQLNVGPDYFLSKVCAHRDNKWLAYFSMLILGRDPQHEKSLEAFEEVRDQISDNQLRGCLDQADRVRLLASQYANLSSPQARISFALTYFRGSWNPLVSNHNQSVTSSEPLAGWSQGILCESSRQDPDMAARAVLAIDLADDLANADHARSFRSYVARFLCKPARKRFLQLEKAARKAGAGDK